MLLKPHLKNCQKLYEQNYRNLLAIMPELVIIEMQKNNYGLPAYGLKVHIRERTRYTTLLSFDINQNIESPFIKASVFQVRMYHDARVAEVVSYQGHRCQQAHYAYPNQNMYHKDEKKQLNLLLSEVIELCHDNGLNAIPNIHSFEIN